MKVTPLYDKVLVRRIEDQEVKKGGIIIPDTAKEKPQNGEVIAVGRGKVLKDGSLRPLDLKAGDKIMFGKFAGTEVKIEEEELIILREDDILAIIE